jgi:nitroimidazol reductase NimA-like FMN-containing flavoprotein (pyridoxamine 5'-phosphate oxidase superfamily)
VVSGQINQPKVNFSQNQHSDLLVLNLILQYSSSYASVTDREQIQNSSGKDFALKRDQENEEELFEKLLRAMYNIPYDIGSSKELLRLTEMADYYCALRIVSCTLHAGQRFLWRQKKILP